MSWHAGGEGVSCPPASGSQEGRPQKAPRRLPAARASRIIRRGSGTSCLPHSDRIKSVFPSLHSQLESSSLHGEVRRKVRGKRSGLGPVGGLQGSGGVGPEGHRVRVSLWPRVGEGLSVNPSCSGRPKTQLLSALNPSNKELGTGER